MSEKIDSPQTKLAARLAAAHAAFLKTPEGAEWLGKVEYLRGAMGIAARTGLDLSRSCALSSLISATDSLETYVADPNMMRNPDVADIILSLAERLKMVGTKMYRVN